MPEERRQPRNRAFLPATVEVPEIGLAIPCTVRDISDAGARLQLPASATLPPTFRLTIPKFDRTMTVTQRWRRAEGVGVSFASTAGAAPTTDAPGGRPVDPIYVRKLEKEVAKLRKLLDSIRENPSQVRFLLDEAA